MFGPGPQRVSGVKKVIGFTVPIVRNTPPLRLSSSHILPFCESPHLPTPPPSGVVLVFGGK